MNAIQRFAKNIGSLFTSQILSYLISLVYTIYLVRYLGVENYGILSFALALVSILGIFADFGLNILTTREISREKSLTNKYLNNVFSLKLVTSFNFNSIIGFNCKNIRLSFKNCICNLLYVGIFDFQYIFKLFRINISSIRKTRISVYCKCFKQYIDVNWSFNFNLL